MVPEISVDKPPFCVYNGVARGGVKFPTGGDAAKADKSANF